MPPIPDHRHQILNAVCGATWLAAQAEVVYGLLQNNSARSMCRPGTGGAALTAAGRGALLAIGPAAGDEEEEEEGAGDADTDKGWVLLGVDYSGAAGPASWRATAPLMCLRGAPFGCPISLAVNSAGPAAGDEEGY